MLHEPFELFFPGQLEWHFNGISCIFKAISCISGRLGSLCLVYWPKIWSEFQAAKCPTSQRGQADPFLPTSQVRRCSLRFPCVLLSPRARRGVFGGAKWSMPRQAPDYIVLFAAVCLRVWNALARCRRSLRFAFVPVVFGVAGNASL